MKSDIQDAGPEPDEAVLSPLRRAACRYFTLERSIALERAQALQRGSFCEWTADKTHHNYGVHLRATREAFVEGVTRALAIGSHLSAAASSNRRENVITISPSTLNSCKTTHLERRASHHRHRRRGEREHRRDCREGPQVTGGHRRRRGGEGSRAAGVRGTDSGDLRPTRGAGGEDQKRKPGGPSGVHALQSGQTERR